MDYLKKLKIRIAFGIIIFLIGVVITVGANITQNEVMYSFGAVFAIVGIARTLKSIRILKNKKLFEKMKIAENDERNIMIWRKSVTLAQSIYCLIAAVAIVVLYFMGMESEGNIIAWSLIVYLVIYWLCYMFMANKY